MNARWQKILVLGWLLASAAWLAWAWPRSLALALGGLAPDGLWWGIQPISAAFFGVPVGFMTIALVSWWDGRRGVG